MVGFARRCSLGREIVLPGAHGWCRFRSRLAALQNSHKKFQPLSFFRELSQYQTTGAAVSVRPAMGATFADHRNCD